MNILNEVMTFKEATDYLGRSPSYLNNLVKTDKILKGIDYREAGGIKLILRSVVEDIKSAKGVNKKKEADNSGDI